MVICLGLSSSSSERWLAVEISIIYDKQINRYINAHTHTLYIYIHMHARQKSWICTCELSMKWNHVGNYPYNRVCHCSNWWTISIQTGWQVVDSASGCAGILKIYPRPWKKSAVDFNICQSSPGEYDQKDVKTSPLTPQPREPPTQPLNQPPTPQPQSPWTRRRMRALLRQLMWRHLRRAARKRPFLVAKLGLQVVVGCLDFGLGFDGRWDLKFVSFCLPLFSISMMFTTFFTRKQNKNEILINNDKPIKWMKACGIHHY